MQPQDAYGLEKLASEELAMHYDKDFGIECRIARFHNIYGPYGTWKGGREKAPAAFCRKVTYLNDLHRHCSCSGPPAVELGWLPSQSTRCCANLLCLCNVAAWERRGGIGEKLKV